MTRRAELDIAMDLWVQARRSAVYEHRALSLLVSARKDTIENYTNVHMERAIRKGTEQYRKQLTRQVARVHATLEHLDKMTLNFDAVQAQWRESESSRLGAPIRAPVVYPATVVHLDPA